MMKTKIYVYDFDATLMDTPLPEEGKAIWSDYHGEKYPHRGWWGRLESLDTDVFTIKPIMEVVREYNKHKNEKDGLSVLLTSRQPHFEEKVKEILDKYKIKMDLYLFKKWILTKSNRLDELLKKYPDVNYIEIWDDRDKEIEEYQEWKKSKPNLEIVIHQVK